MKMQPGRKQAEEMASQCLGEEMVRMQRMRPAAGSQEEIVKSIELDKVVQQRMAKDCT